MSTSPGPLGQLPLVRLSGLKRSPSGEWLKASPGAPPLEMTFPLWPTSCAVSAMPPDAWATSGNPRTRVRSEAGSVGTAL